MVMLFRELNGDHLFTTANSISSSKNTRKTAKVNARYLFCIDVNAKDKFGGAFNLSELAGQTDRSVNGVYQFEELILRNGTF